MLVQHNIPFTLADELTPHSLQYGNIINLIRESDTLTLKNIKMQYLFCIQHSNFGTLKCTL